MPKDMNTVTVDEVEYAAKLFSCKVCRMEILSSETLDSFFGKGHTNKKGCSRRV